MRALQARFDQHVDGEGAVVGAQGFGGGQAGEFQYVVGDALRILRRGGCGRCLRGLGLSSVERWQFDRLRGDAIRWLIAVRRVAWASVYL